MRVLVQTALAAVLVGVAGCSSSGSAELDGATLLGPSELAVDVLTCNADLTTIVEESDTEVRIEVTYENNTDDDCRDAVLISLESPLGDRSVVDGVSSQELRVAGR